VIAQNRLARLLFTGRGLPADPVRGAMWHILARSAGLNDPFLDTELAKLTPEQHAEAEKLARQYASNAFAVLDASPAGGQDKSAAPDAASDKAPATP
jgi:hypothetical protein